MQLNLFNLTQAFHPKANIASQGFNTNKIFFSVFTLCVLLSHTNLHKNIKKKYFLQNITYFLRNPRLFWKLFTEEMRGQNICIV